MLEEIRLRRDVKASMVTASLRPIVMRGSNITGGARDILHQQNLQNAFLGWIEDLERSLRHYFESPWVWDQLFTPRWTEIRNLDRVSPRYEALVGDEILAQQARLNAVLDRLNVSQTHFELEVGSIAIVPDTNVFLHYTFFKDLDWIRLSRGAGAKTVRVVVPLIVVEQLDEQTYRGANANRAKAVLRELRSKLDLTRSSSWTNRARSRGYRTTCVGERWRHVCPPHEIVRQVSDHL
jgi:hypothetical protein